MTGSITESSNATHESATRILLTLLVLVIAGALWFFHHIEEKTRRLCDSLSVDMTAGAIAARAHDSGLTASELAPQPPQLKSTMLVYDRSSPVSPPVCFIRLEHRRIASTKDVTVS